MSRPVIIIDAGHGGKDPGGGSNSYWVEKDFNLKISLYQYERFRELGVPVALTRDQDMTLTPEERVTIVKNSGAEYCISNHINAGGGEGAEVIHSIWDQRKLPRMIMDEIVKAGQKERRVFSRRLDENTDYYFMHRETGSVVTYIIEYGFADHENDVERLRNHWKDYAEAVVKAFCLYLDRPYQTPDGYQEDTEPWKKELVDWMYDQKLLDSEAWKKRIEEPIPLWAVAAILKDVYDNWVKTVNEESESGKK